MDLTAWVPVYCDRISVGLIAGAGFLTGIVASFLLANVSCEYCCKFDSNCHPRERRVYILDLSKQS